MRDRPMPLRTARCSNRSSRSGGRGVGRTGSGTRSTGSIVPGGFEERDPDVFVGLEADRDLLPDAHVGGVAPDDVGRQVHAGVLGERDVGDHVRRFEGREPLVCVHREADDRPAARTLATGLADRLRQ